MTTLISILALAALPIWFQSPTTPGVTRSSPVDAEAMFARGIEAYLSSRHSSDGAVFSLPVATMFRGRIAIALSGLDVERWLADKTDEDEDDPVNAPDVHADQPFPDGATHGFPTRLLWCLPSIPESLEYRIVGRQLVILDLELNVVVDVLPHAFGAPLQTRR
jgi:hypothetical protein